MKIMYGIFCMFLRRFTDAVDKYKEHYGEMFFSSYHWESGAEETNTIEKEKKKQIAIVT